MKIRMKERWKEPNIQKKHKLKLKNWSYSFGGASFFLVWNNFNKIKTSSPLQNIFNFNTRQRRKKRKTNHRTVRVQYNQHHTFLALRYITIIERDRRIFLRAILKTIRLDVGWTGCVLLLLFFFFFYRFIYFPFINLSLLYCEHKITKQKSFSFFHANIKN